MPSGGVQVFAPCWRPHCAAIYQLLLHMVFTSRNWFAMQGSVAIILISWNVIFIWETGYWTRAIKRFALFDLLKSLYSDTNIKNVKNCFVNVWRKNIFDIYVTEYGTALTTILPILFLYLNTVTVTAGTFEP